MKSQKLLCIIGPTATGKTDIALELAKKFNGELIACDSRQVYTGLDLGTGKAAGDNLPTSKHSGYWVIDKIKVWLYDVVNPQEQYSVAQYIQDAAKFIEDISGQGKLPIVVGGTGLYLDALLNGVDTSVISPNQRLRQELEKQPLEEIQQRYSKLSPQQFAELNNSERNNKRRLIRKIEILEAEKKPVTKRNASGFDTLKVGLKASKEILDKRIEKRVVKRIDQGMLDEAKELHQYGLSFERMRSLGLEYGVMADFLERKFESEAQFVQVLQQKIKQFAKRQLTWFKRDPEINWFDITEPSYLQKVDKLVQSWYNA